MSSLASIFRQGSGGGGGVMSGLVFLQSQTVAGAASVQFTTGITNTYNNYLLLCENVNVPAASGTDYMGMRLSTNGGSSYIDTGYYSDNFNFSTLVWLEDVQTTYYFAGSVLLSNMTSGIGYVQLETMLSIWDTGAPEIFAAYTPLAYSVPSTIVNAVEVIMTDGSLISGTFHLYAYQQ